jgi:hypothetical protein
MTWNIKIQTFGYKNPSLYHEIDFSDESHFVPILLYWRPAMKYSCETLYVDARLLAQLRCTFTAFLCRRVPTEMWRLVHSHSHHKQRTQEGLWRVVRRTVKSAAAHKRTRGHWTCTVSTAICVSLADYGHMCLLGRLPTRLHLRFFYNILYEANSSNIPR